MLARNWHRHLAKKRFPALRENRLLGNTPNEDYLMPQQPEHMNVPTGPEANAEGTGTQTLEKKFHEELMEALENSEALYERAEDLREQIMRTEDLLEKCRNLGDVERDIRQWNENMRAKLYAIMRYLKAYHEWRRDRLHPDGYREAIEEFANTFSEKPVSITLEPEHSMPLDAWLHLPPEERHNIQEAVETTLATQGAGDPRKEATEVLDEAEATVKEREKILEEMVEVQQKQEAQEQGKRSLLDTVKSIEMRSVMDYYNAAKEYYEALSSAWSKRSKRISSKIATDFGSAMQFLRLPLSDEVQTELASAREKGNDEEKQAQIEYLKQNNTTFSEALSALHTTKGNANKFNGTMEYMAENGWLYNLDKGAKTLFGISIPRPPGWTEEGVKEYLVRMESQDSDGQENQKKRMQNIIGTADSIEPIAAELKRELEGHNYWAAYAALEIAMQKGKIGESGTWISTIFLNHLRDNPDARKYVPIDLFDQLGNLGITHPAWTPTLFKLERADLDKWKRSGDSETFQRAGLLAKTIYDIEKEVAQKFGKTDEEISNALGDEVTKDQVIARVLSAQPIRNKSGTQTISIFADKYTKYRKLILDTDTSLEVQKADDDFYGNISDAHLIGVGGLRSIFQINTQGGFNYLTKANSYIINILKLDDELGKKGKGHEQENFRREMREKLDQYFQEDVARHTATKDGWLTRTIKNKDILGEFLERKMLSEQAYRTTFGDKAKAEHLNNTSGNSGTRSYTQAV